MGLLRLLDGSARGDEVPPALHAHGHRAVALALAVLALEAIGEVADDGQVEVEADSIARQGGAGQGRASRLADLLIHLLRGEKAKIARDVAGLPREPRLQRLLVLWTHAVPADEKGICAGVLPGQGLSVLGAELG